MRACVFPANKVVITNTEVMEAVLENPYVLIHDKRISAATDIVPLMEKLLQKGKRDLVVIAEDVDGVAIIRVGAATETELKEKKHRVEDALSVVWRGNEWLCIAQSHFVLV